VKDEIERLLFHEADLLDSGRFQEWLALLAPELRYWAPVRAAVARKDERDGEAQRLPLFDETKGSLGLRVSRLETGIAWIDVPPTRTRRLISNIMADPDDDGSVRVKSNFVVFRSRGRGEEWFAVGCREDRWIRAPGWLLKERKILLDQSTVENLPLFL
jgi:3-phenylpropionate/cinnamic acid dioxygenase small subunit